MRALLPLCLAAVLLPAATPLAVVRVERPGLPPYEDANRVYRLEGEGCDALRPGQSLGLARAGEVRPLGRLEVVEVHPGFAWARIQRPGATFPMKGDWVVPLHPVPPLPALPALPRPGDAAWARMVPPVGPAEPSRTAPAPAAAHQGPIYFFPDEASLTPGALTKLKAWVKGWGRTGRWVLQLPGDVASPLDGPRVESLRRELNRLGVRQVETGIIHQVLPPSEYPAVLVVKNPC